MEDTSAPAPDSQDADADVYEADRQDGTRISREERGSPHAFLTRASRLLAGSLDYETTLRNVAGLALPYFEAWCIVDIVEHENDQPVMRRLAIVHPDPEKEEITGRLERSWPPDTEDPIGAPVVLRTRRSQVVSEVTDEMLRQVSRNEDNLRDLRRLGMGSFLVTPLIAREQVLGAMTFIFPAEGEAAGEEHLDLAENLAAVCALSIDNARHYRKAQEAQESAWSERDARRYAEAIVDTVRNPLLILDQDLRVETANRSFYRSFPVSPEETEGSFIYDVGGGQWHNPRLRQLLEDILPLNTQFEDFEITQTFETLGPRTMLLNARRVQRDGGTELILLAIEDVTERRRAEAEREHLLERERVAKHEAEHAVQARKQVLGIVSHDLRAPLNVISSTAHLLRMLPLEKRREVEDERLEGIIRSTERMDRLIDDLLDLSRIEAGRFSVVRATVDVEDLLAEVCRVLRVQTEDPSVEVECACGEGASVISADRDRIFQVLENLVGNARKFTPEGGRIEIRAESTEAAVLFSVSNTGSAISEEDQEHLFDAYWHGKDLTGGGAGLGLSISKGIVEEHGGRIWVESPAEDGRTVFSFTIPVPRAA